MGTDFKDKVVVITGGSSGIGLALAKQLATQGVRLCLAARRLETLRSAAAEVQRVSGQACELLSTDVADPAQAERLAAYVSTRMGSPDLLINSAGITQPGTIQDLGLDVFRRMMEVNYLGTVNMVKAVLPEMLARGSGHIVNISSAAGFLGVYGYSAYGASKYAVRGFSDVLRAEIKPHGIRVSVVFPPDTDTPQLAYELPFKPPETKALTGTAAVRSADYVAASILRGVRHGHYIILPGFDTWLLYHLGNLLGNAVYPIMDWLIARARRKKQTTGG